MPLDVSQALEANTLLRSTKPYMGSAIQKTSDFSSLLLSSGIPQLREVLSNIATLPASRSHSLQEDTAQQLATSLLDSLGSSLADAKSFLHDASAELGQLELRAARDKRHSQIELGFTDMGYMDLQELVADHPQSSEKHAKTQQPANTKQDTEPAKDVVLLEDGKKDVEDALEGKKSRLHWWKLPFGRADDIAPELANALVSYFGGLERKVRGLYRFSRARLTVSAAHIRDWPAVRALASPVPAGRWTLQTASDFHATPRACCLPALRNFAEQSNVPISYNPIWLSASLSPISAQSPSNILNTAYH
jgi:hypothetical protein